MIVENQIAFGDKMPVAKTLTRLRAEGLNRHEAIHAIANTLAKHLFEVLHGSDGGRSNDDYYADLTSLTAVRWRQMDRDDAIVDKG